MEHELSSFQERSVLLMSAAALLRLALWKRQPPWGGIVLFGVGALLIRAGLDRLGSPEPREYRPMRSEPQPNVMTEGSMESLPASDLPV
jgi:hypothetical protein